MRKTTPIYQVVDWARLYEPHPVTRQVPTAPAKSFLFPAELEFVQQSLFNRRGYYLAGWIAILQVASRCFPRGVLVQRDGRGFTSKQLAERSGAPQSMIESSLTFFTKIHWLKEIDSRDLELEIERATQITK